ncbi:UDP-N-acetylmuramoyl-L-alanine--D-glutamate ligase [Clostridium hydrogeniformans]|uniref:UDP-N-acetylmuramoyl-L-alanine--D-glutamate ligase n=1 Tax=Clostridium hydrogeniformans TaxID=349933 RepID=UPI0004877CFF|nr:UDP-N-acetylmuramoyl-L-alanine--D-glutamate ligase [Clostridium hydrogeniformans]
MKRDFDEFKSYIRGKKVAVVGIGVSNIPLINFLIKLGAQVTAFDKKNKEDLGQIAEEFLEKGIKLELGEGYLDRLTGFEVIFKTPGMRIDSEALVNAKKAGAKITSEMEEFVKYCKAKIYGITGSDGKTTTTSIIYNLLKEEGITTWVGGNIGTPLFSKIEEIKEDHRVVLELSSFQLMTMDVSPEIAMVTNLSPNHLDMHKDMEEYVDSKKNIFKYQDKDSVLILNRENEITYSFEKEAKGEVRMFTSSRKLENGAYYYDGSLYLNGEKVCNKEDIIIKGMHNVENYLAAFIAVKDEVSLETMKKVATTFTGVDHRNQFVREVNKVMYYNDSIGSSPTRTLATISVFDKPVILIAGGSDKNIPFDDLAFRGYEHIKEIVLMGATKHKIMDAFKKLKEEKNIEVPCHIVSNLEEAVEKTSQIAREGDYVVLSPACASFDMFKNFEIRGNKFKELVEKL